MGYFNYFIKCIIRNISYRLCKPKVLFTILLSIIILFSLKHFGFCALSDLDYEMIADGLATVTSNQGTIISQLSSMGVNVSDVENELKSINSDLDNIISSTSNMDDNLLTLLNRVNSLNNTLTQMAQQQNIYYENVTSELEEIKNILTGSSEEVTEMYLKQDASKWLYPNPLGVSMNTTVYDSNPGDGRNVVVSHFKYISDNTDFSFEKGYTYTVTCQVVTSVSGGGRFYYTYDDVLSGNEISVNYLGYFTQNSFTFTITPIHDGNITFLAENFAPFWLNQAHYTITKVPNGSLSSIGDNLNNVNNTINQGNQLQQESNQLQQEQNDILTNDEVNTDDLQFAQDNTNNPTSEGFNTLFMTIYNAFCNSTSSPLTVTLPFINQTFTISPNLVSQGMEKMRTWFNC